GNAQYITKNRLLHHGTLLYSSNLDDLEEALNVSADKIESKGIKSVRSRVTNICDHLQEDIGLQKFKELLLESIFNGANIKTKRLVPEDQAQIKELVKTKYSTWKWNFGESPAYNLSRTKRFNSGKVELKLYVKDGIIKECKIYGDFFGMKDIADIEHLLTGKKFEENEIRSLLETVDVPQYFGGLSHGELMELFV
ncbi:MAG: lipoate--protein ligase, partial [Firmicutes bacterium]|nr:lipoate--protein ligase [Bacillota bacterium]